MPNLSCRALFDIPDDVAYFNTAYNAPLLRASRDALARSLGHASGHGLFHDVVWEDAPAHAPAAASLPDLVNVCFWNMNYWDSVSTLAGAPPPVAPRRVTSRNRCRGGE